jgi:hypothetical protein
MRPNPSTTASIAKRATVLVSVDIEELLLKELQVVIKTPIIWD